MSESPLPGERGHVTSRELWLGSTPPRAGAGDVPVTEQESSWTDPTPRHFSSLPPWPSEARGVRGPRAGGTPSSAVGLPGAGTPRLASGLHAALRRYVVTDQSLHVCGLLCPHPFCGRSSCICATLNEVLQASGKGLGSSVVCFKCRFLKPPPSKGLFHEAEVGRGLCVSDGSLVILRHLKFEHSRRGISVALIPALGITCRFLLTCALGLPKLGRGRPIPLRSLLAVLPDHADNGLLHPFSVELPFPASLCQCYPVGCEALALWPLLP